ncbi:MAG: hypothetical protein ACE5FJ_06515 [Gemmatimonadales bacterium]
MASSDETKGFWQSIQDRLKEEGLDMESLCCGPAMGALKLVCVPTSLRESVEEMGGSPRDQVVMVRVDGQTVSTLDLWVQTGAVKSRSEAAAVFIREGLKVRSQELQELQEALSDVEAAKSRLREKARQVLDRDEDSTDHEDEEKES